MCTPPKLGGAISLSYIQIQHPNQSFCLYYITAKFENQQEKQGLSQLRNAAGLSREASAFAFTARSYDVGACVDRHAYAAQAPVLLEGFEGHRFRLCNPVECGEV